MKALKSICQVLCVIFGVGAFVLFFTQFATINASEGVMNATATQLAFGAKVSIGETVYDMAKSSDILFCMIVSLLTAALSALSFKFRGSSIAAPLFAAVGGIYMLVIALSKPNAYVDTRPLTGVTSIEYSQFVLFTAIALLACAVIGLLFIFVRNLVEVKESNGKKRTIAQAVLAFIRDYKGEIKKIVWPTVPNVVKNTLIVFAVCAIIGAFIWVLDFGLAKLLNLILGI